MENNNWLSIKKQYFTDERWDVLAHGLNRVFMEMNVGLKIKIENALDKERGECILLMIERREKK